MAQGHGDRLSALDAAFLRLETRAEHMHTCGLFVFHAVKGVEFDFQRFLDVVRSRLHLVPRFRQKLAFTPFNLSTPIWIDDDEFDLGFHVRHAALPRPGRMDQLMDYVGRLVSRQLDRDRPLWEIYVIEGLEEGRTAYLGKTHHAMIDGVTGIDIATLLLDYDRDASAVIPDPPPWHAAPRPSDASLAWSAVRDQLLAPRSVVDNLQRLVETPRVALGRALRLGQSLASMASATVAPGPASALNQQNGVFRRVAIQRLALDDVKRVKDTYDTTVNDVVLAIVGDAVGRFLRSRGEQTRGLELRVMVPVSVRADEDDTIFGNRVSSVFVRLPVDEMDPTERLAGIHEAMKDVKDRQHAVGADFLVDLSAYAPPTIHALAARVTARTRLYNFVVTNVPGPQVPLYSMGMRLLGAFPILPLAQNHSFAVGVTSIDGWLNFGFTGDWDALPDLENITVELADSLRELVKHAEAAHSRTELARKRTPTPDR